jgi:uncharacterized protein
LTDRRARTYLVTLGLATALLVACGTPPKERYYTLSSAPQDAGAATKALSATSIVVGPVSLPDRVDRAQLVVNMGPNRVAILEQERWAGPLKSEIARVIAENLSRELGAARVSTYPSTTSGDVAYQVVIEVQAFESSLGDAVTLDALWTIRTSAAGVKTGRSTVREPAQGTDYDALVGAHSRALAHMSGEIARAVRSFESPLR